MRLVQTIDVTTDDIQRIRDHLSRWHREQAGVAPGYQRARILADDAQPRRYVIEVEFTSKDDAEKNNERPETSVWASQLEGLVDGSPKFANYELVATTG